MIDWLNDNSGAIQAFAVVALVVVTGVYVWFTRQMVREMREQRLGEDRPYLLIDVTNAGELEWHKPEGEEQQANFWLHTYPLSLVCRIHNAGRHVAKEVEVTALHPGISFAGLGRGFLLPGDTWETDVKAVPRWLDFLADGPVGLSKWLEAHGASLPEPGPGGYDAGVVAFCRDIHNVDWATCLVFTMVRSEDFEGEISHELYFLGQHLIRLRKERGIFLRGAT
jgi:hypothetical protein